MTWIVVAVQERFVERRRLRHINVTLRARNILQDNECIQQPCHVTRVCAETDSITAPLSAILIAKKQVVLLIYITVTNCCLDAFRFIMAIMNVVLLIGVVVSFVIIKFCPPL